jgi:uncharacterized repeat protein (TIGR03837 family)
MPSKILPTPPATLLWDVFCRVIDNFGDVGVCWRLCADLAARGHRVRFWVDDASALAWMAPGALDGRWPGIQVLEWEQSTDPARLSTLAPADVWIEGFGCEIATEFIATYVDFTRANGLNNQKKPVWINLEYLSAERYVERSHGLPSPVLHGPAQGWTKYFFYPGFSAATGGLLREPGLLNQRKEFGHDEQRRQWLAQKGIAWAGERLVSLFCYEPATLPELLQELTHWPSPTRLLVTPGRAAEAVKHAMAQLELGRAAPAGPVHTHQDEPVLGLTYLPTMTQTDFDRLLWVCDLNCVRGEDSVVRAIWAGKPLLWHIYPQHDAAHVAKLEAFLDLLGASRSLRKLHHAWNGTSASHERLELPLTELDLWGKNVQLLRQDLSEMEDLTSQLVHFILKKQ